MKDFSSHARLDKVILTVLVSVLFMVSVIAPGSVNARSADAGSGAEGGGNESFAQSAACPATFTGWKAEYWSNPTLSGEPVLCRDDAVLDLEWNMDSPDPLIPNDNFSARWTRTIEFDDGLYQFSVRHDNGARIYIDDVLFADFWATCCDWDYAEIAISKGPHVIRMEYFEADGAAHAELWWENINDLGFFPSIGALDGQILESLENSKKGGTRNYTSQTFSLGDDAKNRQYLGILSFETVLPANAVVTDVTLMVRKAGSAGTGNPVKLFGGFIAQVKKGTFGSVGLSTGDFQSPADFTSTAMKPALDSGWYSFNLNNAKSRINTTGLTQIRLKFKIDDNNNLAANYLKLYSGNAPFDSQPLLIIEYYVP